MARAGWGCIVTVGCRNPCDDIERLKVCGTCFHCDDSIPEHWLCEVDQHGDADVWMVNPCHFTPSEWRPYWETSDDT